MYLEFILTSLIVIATPGTGALYTVVMGLSHGKATSLVAAGGCTLGIVPHMIAAILGLAAVLVTNDTAFQIVKLAGAGYLLYMAISIWRDASLFSPERDRQQRSAVGIIRHAVLINLFNPKLSIFFFALLPQFVTAQDEHAVLRMTEYSLAFMVMTFVVFALYGLFAATARDKVLSRPKLMLWIRKSFAAAFVTLGLKLALAER
ncbi:LysE family translocator [Rhizobium daejeonense]|uniref:LysE family translocator n=1 Tax=Rhizobium daejeonense TaxID=240521 RepID=A0A6M1RMW3_9HYPH|nr:LysE family translocator [Rhizobium daejeonense]NGO62622.1 LysE family translocator [Rhizobium daejeonense]